MKPGERVRSKSRKKQPTKVKTRKELRKENRKQKKLARVAYFEKRKEFVTRKSENVQTQKPMLVEVCPVSQNRDKAEARTKRATEKRLKDIERKKEKLRQLQLKEANLEEDRVIKRLEKQLKLNKRKKNNIPKSFVADGLDYLLDFCIEENRERAIETEKQMLENASDTEFKNDLTMVIRDNDAEDDASSNNEESDHDNDMIIKDSMDADLSDDDEANKMSGSGEEIESDASDVQSTVEEVYYKAKNEENESDYSVQEEMEEVKDKNSGVWEDIYGRKRDKKGNVVYDVDKYIPPAARKTVGNENKDNEKLQILRKRLKGSINRLAEHNIHSIANQLDELYMTNSRNDMNDLLAELMMEALVAPVLTPDRLVSEHMMLIAILHANVGVEVGGQFLLTLVKKLDEMLGEVQDVENKELDNLILMLSHLYNFKLYGHRLLYQILERLAQRFTEKEIQLILLILRTVGFPLRKDDPVALKEFIQSLQQRALQEKGENSRVKYMLDVLLAIKNNNVSKIPQYDPFHVEHLKKVVRTVVRKGNAISPFNVTLEDLLLADERGKWWVVGSAWSGPTEHDHHTKRAKGQGPVFGQKMLELARKQRMNTDTRKNIFCVLMTAEDYLDAFENLHHLGLKDQQEREVIHVIMHCCLQEKKFNPYYAVLAQKLCEYERKYQLTIQYTLWDKLKTLGDYSATQLSNMARFLTHLFLERSLSFSILKIIQFAELDKHTMKLLRQIVLGILLYENEESCLQVFERISVSPKLQSFRESLRLFISHFLIKNVDAGAALGEQEAILKRRAELVDKLLTPRASRIIF